MTATPTALLEQAKKRLEGLTGRRTRLLVQIETGRQQLADARKEAEGLYGTSDLGKLQALLAQQEQDNAQALAEFTRAVGEFEGRVTLVEAALADPGSPEALQLLAALPPETVAPPVGVLAVDPEVEGI